MYCARFERVVLGQIPPRITGIKVGYFGEALVVINSSTENSIFIHGLLT